MLPHEPETIEQMKARFPAAIAEPVDIDEVIEGTAPTPGKDRKHVFDFEDGMRVIISIDVSSEERFLHLSASGDEAYADTLGSEGLDGFLEDILLRFSAIIGRAPKGPLKSYLTSTGVLHILFKGEV